MEDVRKVNSEKENGIWEIGKWGNGEVEKVKVSEKKITLGLGKSE